MPQNADQQPDREFRACQELRIERGPDDRPRLVGYAAVFNSRSQLLAGPSQQGFSEIIRPGAFKRSLAAGADVRALVNHDPSLILGRRKAGTLKVEEDERGLRVEIMPGDTQVGRDAVENVRRGDIDGMSFGFLTPRGGDRWNGEVPPLRELLDVDVFDVSIATYPAYLRPDVAVRSLEIAFRSLEWAKIEGLIAPPTTPGVVQEALSAADIDRRRRLRLAELG